MTKRMTKAQERALSFARFVANLERWNSSRNAYEDAPEFVRRANASFNASERACCYEVGPLAEKRAENNDARLVALAAEYGCKVEWPGLYPRLTRPEDGAERDYYIPEA